MGRPARINAPDLLFHLTARGNRKQTTFTDARDRERFLQLLGREIEHYGWRCHAYCLMTNHYHLLIETPRGDLSAGMHHLNGVYAKWFNWRHGYEGHLFERRFHDVLLEGEVHLLELTRYIVLNPVRAGLVHHPLQWPWSSYRATVGGQAPAFLTTDWILRLFAQDPRRARELYATFVAA
jgi:REP element-mobilizing transposase RayT